MDTKTTRIVSYRWDRGADSDLFFKVDTTGSVLIGSYAAMVSIDISLPHARDFATALLATIERVEMDMGAEIAGKIDAGKRTK